MRQYLAALAPELEVVELPEAHTTEYISRRWKVLQLTRATWVDI